MNATLLLEHSAEHVACQELSDRSPAVPVPLREYVQWVARRGKLPINPHTGGPASTSEPNTWGLYSQAVVAVERYRLDGIGFVLTAADPFTCIDLDHCRDAATGDVEPWALRIVERLDTFTEASPSGTGLHVWLRAPLPVRGARRGGIEAYYSGRYITVTGDALDGYGRIEERPDALAAWYSDVFGAGPEPGRVEHPPTVSESDTAIIERATAARNGDKVSRLFDGDASGYSSQSEADQALLCCLAFYTRDPEQLLRLMRASGLYRVDKEQRYSTHDVPAALAFTAGMPPAPAVSTSGAVDRPPTESARVAELEAQLAEERRARSALEEQNAELQRALSAQVYVMRNTAIRTESRTAVATAHIINYHASQGPGEELPGRGDGWYRVAQAAIAEQSGDSERRVGDHMGKLEEWGVFERATMWGTRDRVDTDTGEITAMPVRRQYLRTTRTLADTLNFLADLKPEKATTWGGRRRPVCPDHPDAGTVVRHAVHCQECNRLLEAGAEYHRAEAVPDGPDRQDDGSGMDAVPAPPAPTAPTGQDVRSWYRHSGVCFPTGQDDRSENTQPAPPNQPPIPRTGSRVS